PDRDRSSFIARDVQKTIGQIADASQILDHRLDDFMLLRIGRLSLKQFDCERQRCERRFEFIRKRSDQVRARAFLVTKISRVMKSDHRAKRSATIKIQRCGLQQVRMIASANVQTYFCLLLAPWIAEGALQGGSDMHVVTIVAFEVEERTAQDSLAINTKYQCGLLIEMGNNIVEVYQNRCDVEVFQNCRRPAVFTISGCRFHIGKLAKVVSGPRGVRRTRGPRFDLLRLPVLVSQGEVELQHVDELLAREPAE